MEKKSILDLAIVILRLGLGLILVVSGAQKLFGAFGGSGITTLSANMAQMSINHPLFWAWVVALIEGLGGLFIILGVLPRISAGLIAAAMLGAAANIHGAGSFLVSNGSLESQYLIVMVALALVFMGAGKISLFNKL